MEIVPKLRIWKLSLNLEMLIRVDRSSTVAKSHSPSAIASDELSLAIGDVDIGYHATKRN